MEHREVTIALRVTGQKKSVSQDDLTETVEDLVVSEKARLLKESQGYFDNAVSIATDLKELKDTTSEGRGFVKVPFCSIGLEGKKCADILKEKTNGGCVSGIPFGDSESEVDGADCIVCRKEAEHIVYVARSY